MLRLPIKIPRKLLLFSTSETSRIKNAKQAVNEDSIKIEENSFLIDTISIQKNDTDEDASEYNSKQSQANHNENRKRKSTCKQCKATFKSRSDMLAHTREIHTQKRRRKTDIQHKVFCDICNAGYTRRHDMEKHRKSKHSDAPEKTNSGNVCGICGIHFEKHTLLKRHLQEQHNIVKRQRRRTSEIVAEFFCDVCSKGFTRKHDMQKHRSSKHTDAPELRTSEMKVKNLKMLERCKVPSDDNKSYYKCDTCNRLFRHSYNFIRHQSVHTGMFL